MRVDDAEQTIPEIVDALRAHPHILLVGATSEDGKAFGIDPTFVSELIALQDVDAVLVEADGSRMRPFKAPAEHEPVVPRGDDLFGAGCGY